MSSLSSPAIGGAGTSSSYPPSTHKKTELDSKTYQIFQKAEQALSETLALNIKTIEKIVPCTEEYHFLKSLEDLYIALGPKCLESTDFATKFNYLRDRFLEKIIELKTNVSSSLALFAKTLRYSGCQEISMLCVAHEAISIYHRYNIYLTGDVFDKSKAGNDHSLIVVSETELCIDKAGDEFIPYIAKQKNAVVIDPYLETIIHSKDILKASKFADQLKCMGTTKIILLMIIDDSIKEGLKDPKMKELESYLLKIKDSSVEPPIRIRSFLYDKRKETLLESLKTAFPSFKWKISPKNDVWTLGMAEDLNLIKKTLDDKKIVAKMAKIVGKEEYCLTFNFKSYDELKELTSKLKI